MSARFIIGDVFDVLATLPDDSVDLVFSSPPFLALRSYLPADHPDKGKEIGSEATPADFLDTLLDVVEACDRVLTPHGSLCFELGDTFSGSGGAGGDYADDGLRAGQPRFRQGYDRRDGRATMQAEDYAASLPVPTRGSDGWPLAKSLCGIPTLFAWSLAYGRNLLRPERTTPRWRIRNVVVWARPNPPVGALGDKFRPATSYLTVACKSDRRWFDLDSVRNPDSEMKPGGSANSRQASGDDRGQGEMSRRAVSGPLPNPAGAPPLDYWEIPTHPFPGSHYACMPPALCVKPIKAMCPSKVCRVCGEPSRRVTEQTDEYAGYRAEKNALAKGEAGARANSARGRDGGELADDTYSGWSNTDDSVARGEKTRTTGWTDCGCELPSWFAEGQDAHRWRNGVVLDPFAGSGTTLAVATGHGRDAIGIDIDERNADLALERVGPLLLTVETLEGTEPFDPPVKDVDTEFV